MDSENMNLAVVQRETDLAAQEEIKEYRRGSVAANTLKAYGRAYDRFQEWLAGREMTDDLLSLYLIEQDRRGLAPATIAMTLKAVRWTFAKMGYQAVPFPKASDVLKRINRDRGERGRGQVDALNWDQVEAVCGKAEDSNTIAGLRDSGMIRLMSDCLLRISELVAVNAEDIKENALEVRASKTDQTGRGEALYVGDDTLEVISEYRQAAGITEGALFRRVRRGDHVTDERLTVVGARNAIKKRVSEASRARNRAARSLSGIRVSGHSMRVGSAVSLAQAGASVVDMQEAGRWKDPAMPAHYARAELAKRGAIARYKYRQ